MSKPVIGFFGLTHLGIVSSLASAAKGFETIAVDTDTFCVERLAQGEFGISEPGLEELCAGARPRIVFTADHDALARCDVVFLSSDTPLDEQSRPDHEQIKLEAHIAMQYLRKDAVFVILSQVPPGFTRQIDWPKEQLFCQVETLRFGDSVERAMHPERIIVGCSASGSWARVWTTYLRFLEGSAIGVGCPILSMSYESAELAKIAINLMLIAQITATNTLAEICEKTGADWQEIVPALQSDPRIGSYLQPGLGLGGGHIERDLQTLLRINPDSAVVESFLDNSDLRRGWLLSTLEEAMPDPGRVALLGLAYKAGTASTVNSPALALMNEDCDQFTTHDPVVSGEDRTHANARDAIAGADALVIATPWPEYKSLTIEDLQKMAGRLVIDPYRVLDGRAMQQAGFEYHALGMMPLKPL